MSGSSLEPCSSAPLASVPWVCNGMSVIIPSRENWSQYACGFGSCTQQDPGSITLWVWLREHPCCRQGGLLAGKETGFIFIANLACP